MLKVHPQFGIYDLSFKAAVKSLIKDGFISPELIDSLYTKSSVYYSRDYGMSMEEAKAAIRAKVSPWVWLCRTGTVTCVKLKPYGTDDKGRALYTYDGHTRACACPDPKVTKLRGYYGTIEQIRNFCTKQNADKPFISVCRKNSEGALELVGYVI